MRMACTLLANGELVKEGVMEVRGERGMVVERVNRESSRSGSVCRAGGVAPRVSAQWSRG